jgi:hypothetical protein
MTFTGVLSAIGKDFEKGLAWAPAVTFHTSTLQPDAWHDLRLQSRDTGFDAPRMGGRPFAGHSRGG